jgi:hypothetical protein
MDLIIRGHRTLIDPGTKRPPGNIRLHHSTASEEEAEAKMEEEATTNKYGLIVIDSEIVIPDHRGLRPVEEPPEVVRGRQKVPKVPGNRWGPETPEIVWSAMAT